MGKEDLDRTRGNQRKDWRLDVVTRWTKIEDEGERPKIDERVLLYDNKNFFVGKMIADGKPPMWRYFSGAGEIPTRDFIWWSRIDIPNARNIGGGPIYHIKGTVVGAMRRP